MTGLRTAAERLSPRHRRWRELLTSLTLDPDSLPRPVAAPSERDFIICGLPRSGTSLLAAALYRPPDIVTVMEPWDGFRLPPADLFASLREEIKQTGGMARGRLDGDALAAEGAVRWGRDGEFPHKVDVDPGYLLGVKWPAFWRYLPLLPDTKFLVCVRDPVEVITSFKRTGGRLASGLEYDVLFHRAMNAELERATGDVAVRRVLLFDRIAAALIPHLNRPNVFTVRYERWFQDPEGLINEVGNFLGVRLSGLNVALMPAEVSEGDPGVGELVGRHSRAASSLGYPTVPISAKGAASS